MYLDKELKPYNIGPGQFYLLMPLFQKDGVNQESLGQSINLDRANVTRSVQKLVTEGYVYQQRDDQDRRSQRIFLTEKGRAIEPGLKKIALEWDNILLSNFDSDQRQTITNSFENMIKNVSRIVEK
jgi:DNA-binding MarR family transcriptional regulator